MPVVRTILGDSGSKPLGVTDVERSAARASAIKIGTGYGVISPFEQTIIQAAALAQRATSIDYDLTVFVPRLRKEGIPEDAIIEK